MLRRGAHRTWTLSLRGEEEIEEKELGEAGQRWKQGPEEAFGTSLTGQRWISLCKLGSFGALCLERPIPPRRGSCVTPQGGSRPLSWAFGSANLTQYCSKAFRTLS